MKLKILTVDDSKTIRLIVGKALKPFECDILEAANGLEGLAVAVRERPDLVILDLTMPVMDGVEMLSKLKSNPDLKGIPVIMLTAEAGRETVLKIAKMGVRDYLVKPFREDLLVERVRRVIDLKPKGVSLARVKRFDEPLNILLVDDKPAILEQIRAGLADTPWKVEGRTQTGEAVDYCSQVSPDVILISLSLLEGTAFSLFQMFRASAKMQQVPVFGLCVKTAVDEQLRAQQAGFTGIITKPIDFQELRSKIARTLRLDSSYKYFQQENGVLILRFPSSFTPTTGDEISSNLRAKVAEAVDAGLDKMVVDMSLLKAADVNIVKLCLTVIQFCHELSLKNRIVASDTVRSECKRYEEAKDWNFVPTYEKALESCGEGTSAPVASEAPAA